MEFFRQLTGREPTGDEVAAARKLWDDAGLEEIAHERRQASA